MICQLSLQNKREHYMRFIEVFAHFDYKISNIAKSLDVTPEAVRKWRRNNKISYPRQCQIEMLTNGKLKAEKEKT